MWVSNATEDRQLALYLRMGFDVVSAFYLNSASVQRAFSGPKPAPRPHMRIHRIRWPRRFVTESTTTAAAALGTDALTTGDLELLRRFEPQVRYTQGELFFPAAVDGYLAACDLLVGRSEKLREVLVPVGALSVENVAGHVAPPGENLYLRLVQEPFDGIELARWQLRPDRVHFHAPSRLARVGLFARLVDAGFTISLLLRGTVPGGTAAAAQVKYAAAVQQDPGSCITAGSCAGTAGSCSSTCSSTS